MNLSRPIGIVVTITKITLINTNIKVATPLINLII